MSMELYTWQMKGKRCVVSMLYTFVPHKTYLRESSYTQTGCVKRWMR